MNKVQEVLSKVKLRSIEKKVALSIFLLVLYTILLRHLIIGTTEASAGMAIAALVWFVWTGCNIVGVLIVVYQILKNAYENLNENSRIEKIFSWFRSDDR